MLFDVKKPKTKSIVSLEKQSVVLRMQAEQSKTWLSKDIPPEDVFNVLELNKVEFAWMGSGRFGAWWEYADKFYSKFPDEKYDPIPILEKHYGYPKFIQMIVDAKDMLATKDIAEKVEDKLFQFWGRKYRFENSDDLSPVNEVFLALKLGQDAQPLRQAEIYTWIEFIHFIKRSRPYLKFDLLATLTKLLGEDKVIEILTAETDKETLRVMKNILQELSNESLRANVPKSVLAVAYDDEITRKTLGKRKRKE